MAMRRKLNSYLFLASGVQILCSLSYGYDLAGGWAFPSWEDRVGKKLYPAFEYGVLALCLNGLLYHCLSKPLYRGTSGLPLQYVSILVNLNQLVASVCFFISIMNYQPRNGYVIFQFLVYPTTFILGSLLTYYAWNQITPQKLTISGSWLLSRRRDWGIAGTLFSAAEVAMVFWDAIRSFYDQYRIKSMFGDLYKLAGSAMFLQVTAALGYHVLGLKVSKGVMPCHQHLVWASLAFIFIEIVGTGIYIACCSIKKQINIFYYHSFFFSIGTIVSGLGNIYISRKKFYEELDELEKGNYADITQDPKLHTIEK